MQYRPTAEEFLDAIGDLLRDEIIEAVPDALRHRVRVAENVSRILAREQRLGPDLSEHECDILTALLDRPAETDPDIRSMRVELSERLRTSDDTDFDRAAWEALVAITRDDLAVAKPGHDSWEGE